ncbi:hypothetical protein BTUL_0069g00020 [Botrytis tulipae]|uniref:Uncharacterized protein n=1 Tax=Botrytis tulipae TaxID=87230 RepID=A0A4Z1ELX0_9HELO|nr:hypothetical protein BTUL_0069g00020 [Botrytis tulipae]
MVAPKSSPGPMTPPVNSLNALLLNSESYNSTSSLYQLVILKGGRAACTITKHHVEENIEGYLGGVAISPTTDIRSSSVPIGAIVWAGMMLGLKNVFLKFQYSVIFTEEGHTAVSTYRDVEEGGAAVMGLFYHWHLRETR